MPRRFMVLLGLVVLLASAAFAADLSAEVAWIRDLAGVTVTNTQNSSGRFEQTYLVQSPDRTLRQVTDGLRQRGWTIVKTTDTGVAGASVRGLRADKGSMRLDVTVQDAGIVCSMDVDLRASGGSASSSGSSSGAAPTGSGIAAGPSLVLNDSNQEATYNCNGTTVNINSSNNSLRFTGRCSAIHINGSNNEIRVDAATPVIYLNGAQNDVTWSTSANPKGVNVQDNGPFNEVQRTP